MRVRAVILVGFMASGKTSVGRELARRLDWDFVDLDANIEAREGKAVPEIFRERGEMGFRAAETSAIRDLCGSLQRGTVIALGGGAFVQETNRELLKGWPSVFLDAPVDELWQRSLRDGIERPLRQDPKQFARLHEERLPHYRLAGLAVETAGRPIWTICSQIEVFLQQSEWARPAAQGETIDTETGESE